MPGSRRARSGAGDTVSVVRAGRRATACTGSASIRRTGNGRHGHHRVRLGAGGSAAASPAARARESALAAQLPRLDSARGRRARFGSSGLLGALDRRRRPGRCPRSGSLEVVRERGAREAAAGGIVRREHSRHDALGQLRRQRPRVDHDRVSPAALAGDRDDQDAPRSQTLPRAPASPADPARSTIRSRAGTRRGRYRRLAPRPRQTRVRRVVGWRLVSVGESPRLRPLVLAPFACGSGQLPGRAVADAPP